MSRDSNEESDQKKPLTFKDWKCLKDSEIKTKEKSESINNTQYKSSKLNTTNEYGINAASNNRNTYNNSTRFEEPRNNNLMRALSIFSGNNGISSFLPPKNFNGTNSFNDIVMRRNNFEAFNNSINNFNVDNNNVNRFSSLNINFSNRLSNFNRFNDFNSSNEHIKCFERDHNRFNIKNIEQSDNTFSSDGAYFQKDMMQKPMPNINPFRNSHKANQLLQEFDKSRYTKNYNKKKSDKKPDNIKKPNFNNNQQSTVEFTKYSLKEPEVYIPNPKAKIDGKRYIPKPKLPEQNFEITKEEKKQQWKEYRQAMKPFKNRDFYNAKRVVQRLGKTAPSELNEKQLIRLANSRETMAAHKTRLTVKYANYVKCEDAPELGELYLLKKPMTKEFQNNVNLGGNHPHNNFDVNNGLGGGNV